MPFPQDIASRLAQDPRNRIISVSWSVGLGFVFLRASFDYEGETIPPTPIGKVSGLPWGDFDIFDQSNNREDPGVGGDVPIVDPISENMFKKYYQWTPYAPIITTKVIKGQPIIIYYVDNGLFGTITPDNYDDIVGFTPCGERASRIAGSGGTFLDCNSTVTDAMLLMGIRPLPQRNSGGQFQTLEAAQYFADSVNAWEAQFGAGGFQTLSVGSLDIGTTRSAFMRKARATLIINMAKVRKLLPLVNGQKPKSFTFKVESNDKIAKANMTFALTGQGFKVEKGGRRSFPVDADLKPTWSDFPDASGTLINSASGASIDVSVDFETLKVSMRVNGSGRLTEG